MGGVQVVPSEDLRLAPTAIATVVTISPGYDTSSAFRRHYDCFRARNQDTEEDQLAAKVNNHGGNNHGTFVWSIAELTTIYMRSARPMEMW